MNGRNIAAAAIGTLLAAIAVPAAAQSGGELERGAYLARIMDCGGCHTGGALMGKPDPARALAGSEVGFGIPELGIFYPPNLTPDPETGIGKWTIAELVTAIRTGVRPDGRELAPVMPWRAYAALTDADANALTAYLKSLKPVRFQAPPPTAHADKAPGPYLAPVIPQ